MIKDGISSQEQEITSFLMVGQSNMAGRGEWGVVEPIDNDQCFMLRMGRWQRMSEPVNPDRGIFMGHPRSGISLAASFADEFTRRYQQKAGLIPCADGGTALHQWMPGEVLFDHAVMMASLARRTSKLGGILWHQGESDCRPLDGARYKQDLIRMLTELRRQLGDESLPLILGELSVDIIPKYAVGDSLVRLNGILHEIASELPNCAVASSAGLGLKEDGLHFNAVACREFGRRYFEKYAEIAGK